MQIKNNKSSFCALVCACGCESVYNCCSQLTSRSFLLLHPSRLRQHPNSETVERESSPQSPVQCERGPVAHWPLMPLPQVATTRHAIVFFIFYLSSIITVTYCQGYGYPAQNNPFQAPSPTAKSEKSRYFHSDQRCIEDIITYNREEVVYVTLAKYGKVAGRVSFLCDRPGVPERDRPQANYANSAYPSVNLYPYNSRPIHRARVNANASVFLGIPYARPPTKENNRRFKDTISPDHWGSIDAFDFGPSCPQPSEFTGKREKIEKVDEDCLYMNIYSPHVSIRLK